MKDAPNISSAPQGSEAHSPLSPVVVDSAARILESITDAFFALDTEWSFTYLNPQAERLLSRTREQLLEKDIWAEFPEAVGSVFEVEYRRAVTEGQTVSFEQFYPPLSLWLHVRAYPSPEGLSVFFQDITARVERERRERFLTELAERTREMTDPDAVIADVVRATGEFLGLARCTFAEIDLRADTCTIAVDYCADDSVKSMAGIFPISVFGKIVVAAFAAGQTVAIEDVHDAPAQVPAENVAAYDAVGIRAHATAPVVRSARTVSLLSCHSAVPRRWKSEDVELLKTVVERTWLMVEVLRKEQALTRQENALRRETDALSRSEGRYRLLLDSTGEGIYGIDLEGRFTFLNRAASQMLGFTPEEIVGQSGHRLIHHTRPDGTPYPDGECPIYQALQGGGSVHVEDDVFWRADGTSLPVAYTAAPLIEQDTVRGVVVTFSDISERKALEQERERLSEREHNIATQLQTALTPAIPDRISGMAVAKYYEAALDEAGVGGDFYDVFPLDKGCTALVVGDLAGKGLAAARQVATIRNMLRYALHHAHSLTSALESLNELLVEQGLLTGFATLFVGAYDSMQCTLTYVNAGQEPALLRRAATGLVEELSSTGSILGAFDSTVYTEQVVPIAAGDALAIFTDGVTECGATRQAMLGIDGVKALLQTPFTREETGNAARMAEAVALRLVEGVDAVSRGGVAKDDVCLLVAVAEDACLRP